MNTKTNIRRIMISFALSLMLTTAYIEHTNASSANYTIRLCEKSFIGVQYSPRLEKKCGLLWEKWTYEIISNQY